MSSNNSFVKGANIIGSAKCQDLKIFLGTPMKFLRKLIPIQGMELGMHLRADWKQNKRRRSRFNNFVSPLGIQGQQMVSFHICHIFGWPYICHLYMHIICLKFGRNLYFPFIYLPCIHAYNLPYI